MSMRTLKTEKPPSAMNTGSRKSFSPTAGDIRKYVKSNTRTHADTMRFLHRIGLRINKDGTTYVVPV